MSDAKEKQFYLFLCTQCDMPAKKQVLYYTIHSFIDYKMLFSPLPPLLFFELTNDPFVPRFE